MPDPRFFSAAGPFLLPDLAKRCGAVLARPEADAEKRVRDVAPLSEAGPDDLSFLDNRKYVDAFRASKAGACIVRPQHTTDAPPGMALLLTDTPYKAYALAAAALYPPETVNVGVAPTATIHPTAVIGPAVAVGAGAVIGPNAEVSARCRIGPNAVLGKGVRIGEDTVIGANASLSHCLIGARVLIHPGVRIGQRGFGFIMEATGPIKVPQLGRVIIEDDVEIGANSTVDRGSGPDTVIGAGTTIDNLVQIGHNVQVGRGCVIVAQAGIAGSTRLADQVVLAAQAGIAGHLHIGPGTQIGAKAGVMRDTSGGERLLGTPAIPARRFFRQFAVLERLVKRGGV